MVCDWGPLFPLALNYISTYNLRFLVKSCVLPSYEIHRYFTRLVNTIVHMWDVSMTSGTYLPHTDWVRGWMDGCVPRLGINWMHWIHGFMVYGLRRAAVELTHEQANQTFARLGSWGDTVTQLHITLFLFLTCMTYLYVTSYLMVLYLVPPSCGQATVYMMDGWMRLHVFVQVIDFNMYLRFLMYVYYVSSPTPPPSFGGAGQPCRSRSGECNPGETRGRDTHM